MKFPTLMLRDYVETPLTAEALGDLLTMAGFELEGIEPIEGDHVLDIKVVSNRGDGLSVFGLAREVLAKDPSSHKTELYRRAEEGFPAESSRRNDAAEVAQVAIETPSCRRYAAAVFTSVPGAPTPPWIRDRLESAGMRSISLLVDLTNYVMLEIGQPLHAFDLDKLAGRRIVVRQAAAGEKLTTLDGVERELSESMMMICDAERPVAAAGVMGGLETEVTATTKTMLLESANFVNSSVRATRKALGLNTEASYRFERSVDPELVVAALNRFSELLETAIGTDCRVPGLVECTPVRPNPTRFTVRLSRVHKLLNVPVTRDQAVGYLERLGFAVHCADDTLDVTVPTWRPDVVREDDAIEEIGRVHGYEHIPECLPVGQSTPGGVLGLYKFIDQVREEMVRLGFAQIVSHTLRDVHPLDFAPHWRARVRNPHSPEIACLRDSVLPSLCDAAKRNGTRNLHLFEIGTVFVRGEIQYDESPELGIMSIGELEPPSWLHKDKAEANFYTMKGTLEELASLVRTDLEIKPVVVPDPRFHPTRQAALLTTDQVLIGGFGVIHPDRAAALDLPATTIMAEIDLLAFYRGDHDHVSLKPFSRLPSVRRDLAILVAKTVPYAQIEQAIRRGAGDVMERLWLFDVYEGPGVPEGSHSLAVALQLRRFDKTFTDEEANQVRDSVVAELTALGATLR